MTDIMSAAKRSALMQRIQSKNTKPELLVRSALHARGIRYRLHLKVLGTRPDLVSSPRRVAIFINGCFWHGHNCHLFRWPKTRPEFWTKKISGNRIRDQRIARTLIRAGWSVATVWECALRNGTPQHIDRQIEQLEKWIRASSRVKRLTLRG